MYYITKSKWNKLFTKIEAFTTGILEQYLKVALLRVAEPTYYLNTNILKSSMTTTSGRI